MNLTLAVIAIDIDLTVIPMLIIFLAVLGFLWLTIIRDFLKVREAREDRISGSREDATEFEDRADRLASEYDEKLGQMRREALEIREKLKAEGQNQFNGDLEEAKEKAEARIASGRADLEKQVAGIQGKLDTRAKELAKLIADKVVSTT